MVGNGRNQIFDDRPINRDTIIDILSQAFTIHRLNVIDIRYLLRYYKGFQNILNRKAPYTSDINNKVVLNYANSSVRDIVGYTFGKPIQFIPRKNVYRKDIEFLSNMFEYENANTVDNEVATYSAITGVGYFCTLPSSELTSDFMPDIPIKLNCLDPMNTFVIRSSSIGNPIRLTCTYWTDKQKTYFVCYTDTEIYTVISKGNNSISSVSSNNTVYVETNVLRLNPIQEVRNNLFMMGDFEIALGVLNALNQIASDSVNDIENTIKSLLVILNSELDANVASEVKKNRVLELLGAPRTKCRR